MQVSKINQFKKDFANYTTAISALQDVRKKKHYENILKELKNQVNLIDDGHSSYFPGKIEPKILRENIQRLIDLRNELDKLIK